MKRCLYSLILLLTASVAGQAQPVSADVAKEFPFIPVKEWKPGMPFVMLPTGTFSECKLMKYTPGVNIYTAPRTNCSELKGQILTFERLLPIRYDDRDFVLVVLKNNGTQYAKMFQEPMSRFADPSAYNVELQQLVYVTDLEKARKFLTGKTLYPTVHQVIRGKDPQWLPKYVPVKVIKVETGDEHYPAKITVEYTDTKQVYTESYLLSGTGSRRDNLSGQSLARSFSFTDPRVKAGVADNPVWRAIQRGVPLKNMTMNECELAMGKPKRKAELFDEDKRTGWYYEAHLGKSWILEFKNGILDKYTSYDL